MKRALIYQGSFFNKIYFKLTFYFNSNSKFFMYTIPFVYWQHIAHSSLIFKVMEELRNVYGYVNKRHQIFRMSNEYLYVLGLNNLKLHKHRKKSSYENEIEIEKTGGKNSAYIFTLSLDDLP